MDDNKCRAWNEMEVGTEGLLSKDSREFGKKRNYG